MDLIPSSFFYLLFDSSFHDFSFQSLYMGTSGWLPCTRAISSNSGRFLSPSQPPSRSQNGQECPEEPCRQNLRKKQSLVKKPHFVFQCSVFSLSCPERVLRDCISLSHSSHTFLQISLLTSSELVNIEYMVLAPSYRTRARTNSGAVDLSALHFAWSRSFSVFNNFKYQSARSRLAPVI